MRTVLAPAGVTVIASGAIEHDCPYRHENDAGAVTVTWTTAGRTVELHALRAYLDGFAGTKTSHEQVVRDVHNAMNGLDSITDITVAATFSTAGMEVTCSTWPPPPGRPSVQP